MDIFHVLSLIGGLSLFLFGMSVMGQALERSAGGKLNTLLYKLTNHKLAGLLTGLGITAIIQSSSATTVMVVGFVNSGLMTLKQSMNVIIGANIGTTVTAWILSLAGIESSNPFVRFLKPSSFTPVLSLIGILLYMISKREKRKDTGLILLGFSTLMFGMDAMSSAVSVLKNDPGFQQMFLLFTNPLLGVISGAILTAIIQSSSASVGILQALSSTGQVSYGAAIPIIMGQNIGTCITAVISSIGANKNAKRAAMVHLTFNIIGTVVWLSVFCVIRYVFSPALLSESASLFGIAVAHSVFNVLCTVLILPFTGALEKLVLFLIRDSRREEKYSELDERLLTTPSIALDRCRMTTIDMAECAFDGMQNAIQSITQITNERSEHVRACEHRTDQYEDSLSSYLVKLSAIQQGNENSAAAAKLLKIIGDLERISDHAVEIVIAFEELDSKGIHFTDPAKNDLTILTSAVNDILTYTMSAISDNSDQSDHVVPLKNLIIELKEQLRSRHILRMQNGICSIEAGFIWADVLTAMERTAAHCSNIVSCISDTVHGSRMEHSATDLIDIEYRKKYKLSDDCASAA